MENYSQTASTNLEKHEKSRLTDIQTTLATELVENGNLVDGLINRAFTVEPTENKAHEEGINTVHAMVNESFVENRSLVNGLNNSSSTEFVESTNSTASNKVLVESRKHDYDISHEKAVVENRNTVAYGVDERPPLVQSILLGFQVRMEHYVIIQWRKGKAFWSYFPMQLSYHNYVQRGWKIYERCINIQIYTAMRGSG